MPPLCRSLDSLHTLVLLLPLLAMLGHCDDEYALTQVLFCQPTKPPAGVLKMFGEDQMFSFNFTDSSVSPWLKEFGKWKDLAFPDPSTIIAHVNICHQFREVLTDTVKNITPEARGGTHVTVFTAHPLRLGERNTLICAVDDVYPPALTITWRKHANIVTSSLSTNNYFSVGSLSFQAFSYLNVTPYHGDVFSCEVQVAGDNRTVIQYWIPQYPAPSELLENSLCGLGFALGIIFLLLGFLFFCFAKRLHNTD